ncbi:MAG: response regulator [Reyranellaceae bacterium]
MSQVGRVLIVEDDRLLALVLHDALSFAGYAVVGAARRGDEAVGLALAERPDLIVMDVNLADGTDGISAAATILERTGIRCLLATARTDAATRRRATASQPLGWLAKPYDETRLLDAVADALDRCRRPA